MATASKLQLTADGTAYELKDAYAREALAHFPANSYVHNALPGGKNIQTYFDNGKLYENIANGSFDDLRQPTTEFLKHSVLQVSTHFTTTVILRSTRTMQ